MLAAPALLECGRLARSRLSRSASRPGSTALRRLLVHVRGITPVLPDDLQAKVDAAHLPPGLDGRALIGLKLSLAAVAATLAFIAASLSVLPAAPVFMLLLPTAGFLAPDLVLGRRARRISREAVAEVPDFADRLHLAVSAGLPPLSAAAIASERRAGLFSREVAVAVAAAQAGLPFAASLERLVRRCPGPEVRSIAAALRRSQEQGTDIAPVLLDISESARREASLRLRDRAQRAAPKIQLAVALLLVPAAMALIAAALLSGLFKA